MKILHTYTNINDLDQKNKEYINAIISTSTRAI